MKDSEMIDQLSLVSIKKLEESQFRSRKIWQMASKIVEDEGNNSEKHGLKFGLVPQWAYRRAKGVFEFALLKARQ